MKKQIRDRLKWGIIAVLAILIFMLFFLPGKEKSFEIKDKCGPIVNLISHTIADETVCKTRCKSQCKSIEMSFKKVDFQDNDAGCHSCTCFCDDNFFG